MLFLLLSTIVVGVKLTKFIAAAVVVDIVVYM